jgi:hypothetical protein
MMVPRGSYGDDELSEESQNIHKTCGNGPTSCPGLSTPNSPGRDTRNGSHVNQENWSCEQAPYKWNLARVGNRVQNDRYAPQRCKSKNPEHELSEICRPTPSWGPLPFEQAFVWREHAIHRLTDCTAGEMPGQNAFSSTPDRKYAVCSVGKVRAPI